MRTLVLIAVGILAGDVAVAEHDHLTANTPKAACSVLLGTLAKITNAPRNIVKLWYCNHSTIENEYLYFIAVRTAEGEGNPVDQHVGNFAVARRGTLVLYYDVPEDRLEPIPREYYASGSSNFPHN